VLVVFWSGLWASISLTNARACCTASTGSIGAGRGSFWRWPRQTDEDTRNVRRKQPIDPILCHFRWAGAAGEKSEDRRRAKKETSNIEHPTSKNQYLKGSRHRHWMFDVRCWMFDVEILRPSDFGLPSDFGFRSSGLPTCLPACLSRKYRKVITLGWPALRFISRARPAAATRRYAG